MSGSLMRNYPRTPRGAAQAAGGATFTAGGRCADMIFGIRQIALKSLTAAVILAGATAAVAQTSPPGDTPGPVPPDQVAPPSALKPSPTEVLRPPAVDPGMLAPAPAVGTMPVIPPPGSPGGNPTVQPK